MTTLINARKYLQSAPAEALTDVLGLAALAVLIFAGFTLPAFL